MFLRYVLNGIGLGILLLLFKIAEYYFFAGQISFKLYTGGLALLFLIVGVWVGLLWQKKSKKEKPDITIHANELLSVRENEILSAIATGKSNQEIADTLFVSTNTVKTHISNIYNKLGVNRRTQAIAKAKELTILGD